MRIISSLAGAVLNIFLATFLIDHFGHDYFATYVLVTSLPMLMLWADFGLGSLILNTFIDAKQNLLTPETIRQRVNFSFYSILVMGLASLVILVSTLKFSGLGNDYSYSLSRIGLLCIIVVGITSFAVPFSLGVKKFQADDNYLQVMKIQGLIPFSISFLTLMIAKALPFKSELLMLVPSVIYFCNTLFIFIKSGLGNYLTIPKFIYLDKALLQYIRLGLWSLVLTTVVGLTFHLPKYILAVFKSNLEVTGYGLQSLLIIPGISFLAIPAIVIIPKFREMNHAREVSDVYAKAVVKTRLLAFLLAFATILIIPFQIILQIDLLTSSQIIQVCLLIVFAPIWIVPALTLTEMRDIREVARRFIVVMLIALLSASILHNASSFWLLNGFFSVLYLGFWISVSHKNKFKKL